MRVVTMAFLVSLAATQSAQAKPVTLKCTSSDGKPLAVDLIVDLAAGRMSWAALQVYTIIHQNDTYISAYLNNDRARVGGEILVLNRITGIYKQGFVGIVWYDPKLHGPGTFIAETYEGRCTTPLF